MSNFFVTALLIFMQSVQAEEPALSITVEAHQDLEVYVAPIKVLDMSDKFDVQVDKRATFGLASSHSKHAKTSLPIKLYNVDTISYVWKDCNYRHDPMKCSYEHSHYFLETTISVTDEQFITEMLLYNSELQVVARGIWTDQSVIRWIKQQEVTSQSIVMPGGQQSARACEENSCQSISQPSNPTTITNTSKPKEELPLKWVIPHRFLHKHLNQASLGLWIGAKI
jgi:hypothetical protein